MSIHNKVVSTSGFSEVIFKVLKRPTRVDMVEKMFRILNQAKMTINGEVVTTSGFAEIIFKVLKRSIELDMVQKVIRI